MRNELKFSDFVERKDLGITHKDFQRVFPRVCDSWGEVGLLKTENEQFQCDFEPNIGLHVLNKSIGKEIVVKVSEERQRKIGRLAFPYLEVSFWFKGFKKDEITNFMRRFDTAFQKGGG